MLLPGLLDVSQEPQTAFRVLRGMPVGPQTLNQFVLLLDPLLAFGDAAVSQSEMDQLGCEICHGHTYRSRCALSRRSGRPGSRVADQIRRSSRLLPALSCWMSHAGRRPRPDQVS